jgi:hypothetical protein
MTGPARPLHLVPGEITDQVLRLAAFRERFPFVCVNYVRQSPGGFWVSDWYDSHGAACRVFAHDLERLLDRLDRAFGAP